jgi:dynein heavy chain
VPDEDFDSARKAYEWPKRFADVLREAGTKAAAEHRQFEAALKARRKEFDKRVEQYAAELAVVEGRNDIVKREVVASEVSCEGCLGCSGCWQHALGACHWAQQAPFCKMLVDV